ncbi:acyl-CoA dehydrogenase NM domain-like protein [Mycena vulgaris]|nr:acyl-CoA dehydrogenase NM domain-like protein [Mycena vulgaris]
MNPQIILAQSDLFTRAVHDFHLPKEQRQKITHKRARAIALSFDLTVEDVLTCTEKFWDSTLHPINLIDGAATALWTIHVNLACGTLSPYAASQPHIRELCCRILAFEVTAHYMLTEVGHGLNAQNIETTAELRPDGAFEIHTPNPGAAKFMLAGIPAGCVPRIAVPGLRHTTFVVPLNDGKSMYEGVSCRYDRSGTWPVGHAITSFNPFVGDIKSTLRPRIQFLMTLCIPSLRICAYIVTQYAKRRTVANSQGAVVPILSFCTTQVPILRVLSQAAVLEAFYKELRPSFSASEHLDLSSVVDIRNGLAAVFKTFIALTDQLGAQGLFTENQLISMEMEIRGMTIAEGDVTVIYIRLASKLLLGRYNLPEPRYPSYLLAFHEKAVFAEMKELLKGMNNRHRSDEFNWLLLPRSVSLVTAIGHQMAHEVAIDAGVDLLLINLYRTGAVIQDLAWYVKRGIS